MDKLYVKAALVGQKADAEGRKIFTYRATTAARDRQDEVVTVEGWEVDNYRRNPVILDSHQYDGIEHILGRSVEVRLTPEGLEADVIYSRVSPKGALAERLVEEGMLNTVSVGFRSIERARGSAAGEPLKHTRKELLEISMVPVPANPEAMRLRGLDGDGGEDWGAFFKGLLGQRQEAVEPLDAEAIAASIATRAATEAGDGVITTEHVKAAVIAEAKAGRVLSKANEGLLREAGERINTILASLGKPDGEEGKSAGGDHGTGPAAQPDQESGEQETDVEFKADLGALHAFLGR